MQVLGHGILKEHWSREGRPFPRCPLAKQIDHPIRQPLTLGRNRITFFPTVAYKSRPLIIKCHETLKAR